MAKPPPYPPKAMGPKKPLRPKPKRKQGSMDNDLRQFAKPMPRQSGNFRDMGPRKPPKRIGKAVVPKTKKMGY